MAEDIFKNKNKDKLKNYREVKDDIIIPTKEEVEKGRFEVLHETLVKNHKKILKLLKQRSLPNLGLHGTSKKEAESIQSTRTRTYVRAVFSPAKEDPEELLYQIYAMADYAMVYAKKNKKDLTYEDKGSILVVGIEPGTVPTRLNTDSLSVNINLDFDNEQEKQEREKCNRNLPLDALVRVSPENPLFGAVSLDKLEPLFGKFNFQGPESFARAVILLRFQTQIIACETLKLFK
jgi:hypothetical protein